MRPMYQKLGREINDCVKDVMQMHTTAKVIKPIEITLCQFEIQMYTFVKNAWNSKLILNHIWSK